MSPRLASLLFTLALVLVGLGHPAEAGIIGGVGVMGGQGCNAHCAVKIAGDPAPFVDSSPSARAVTNSGPLVQSTTQVWHGVNSINRGTLTHYLSVPDDAAWSFPGNFRMSWQVYLTTSSADRYIAQQYVGSTDRAWQLKVNTSTGVVTFSAFDTGNAGFISLASAAGAVSLNVWTEIEIEKVGSTSWMRINGVAVATDASSSGTVQNCTGAMQILGGGNSALGYYDEARIGYGGWQWGRSHSPQNRRM